MSFETDERLQVPAEAPAAEPELGRALVKGARLHAALRQQSALAARLVAEREAYRAALVRIVLAEGDEQRDAIAAARRRLVG